MSSPAQLALAGQLEFELVGLRVRADDSKRRSVPYQFKLAFSREWGPLNANLNATRLGLVDPGGSRTQWGASASFSTPLSEQWGLTGEVSGTRRSGADSGVQWLTALTWSPSKRLTFDVGVARAVRPMPVATSLFASVVFPIARLW